MDEVTKAEGQMTSAAAFVEGGIQDPCDDACSICLEEFSDNDPATVTSCKHEFHLQCVLEWCQRSSNCPMCWQNITLKDPTSQELLEAVEHERNLRFTPSRNAPVFRHPTLGNFDLQHLPVGVDAAELEDRIIQHLAAAAAMGRSHHVPRREGTIRRPSSQSREYMVFPSQPNQSSATPGRDESYPTAVPGNISSALPTSTNNESTEQTSTSSPNTGRGVSNDTRMSESSSGNQDAAGPSESSSFSGTWRSRFSSLSMKYKESITKSTKELKEKLFSRNSSMTEIGSEVRREVNAGLATVTRMMERLETRDNDEAGHTPATAEQNNIGETCNEISRNGNKSASLASSSVPR
ncbi:E3 ubiquitin-protein ligase RHF2A-like isoform X2 [Andrographis paniculata]|uniref:E3 ubiquitin-protein ligase RHF2A-like isoform X2 n=1 Tax=Andrographis paniculata TaxID=175694 RepID=UPI0021E86005|nr:E3 ubiquitin-protein ligase RHF2A-like isoform X2 [Andrographis paniculata]